MHATVRSVVLSAKITHMYVDDSFLNFTSKSRLRTRFFVFLTVCLSILLNLANVYKFSIPKGGLIVKFVA